MTSKEFSKAWNKLLTIQRKFILAYLETLDPKEAAIKAGYSQSFSSAPNYRIMRKVQHIIDYLLEKNNVVKNIVKPEFVLKEYLKMYENTNNEMLKQNILRDLSKILQMQDTANKVEVNNNIPAQPVTITFTEGENE